MSVAEFPSWLEPNWLHFRKAIGESRLPHALLIAGEAGLGKRALVERMLARMMCQSPTSQDEACDRCPGCTWRTAGTHPDIFRIVPEEDSVVIKVDQVREVQSRTGLTGQMGTTRVLIIDPADVMNLAAQNALLKTLEEPALGVHLMLVADVPARLLPTIRSRCQMFAIHASGAGGGDSRLAAGHPGLARSLASEERKQRMQIVARDLAQLRQGNDTPLAVAQRWSSDAANHVDDAILWLRSWSWEATAGMRGERVDPLAKISDAYFSAIRLRDQLRTPLKPAWLLHEWLSQWQAGQG